MAANRQDELHKMLEDRRRELADDVEERVRKTRTGGSHDDVLDDIEISQASVQDDIELTLTQMKSETLVKIDQALVRLHNGTYGNCAACGGEIAENRLRALPFAVRCKDCEEARENAVLRERHLAARRGTGELPLFNLGG